MPTVLRWYNRSWRGLVGYRIPPNSDNCLNGTQTTLYNIQCTSGKVSEKSCQTCEKSPAKFSQRHSYHIKAELNFWMVFGDSVTYLNEILSFSCTWKGESGSVQYTFRSGALVKILWICNTASFESVLLPWRCPRVAWWTRPPPGPGCECRAASCSLYLLTTYFHAGR